MKQHQLLKKQIEEHLTFECIENQNIANFINAVNDTYNSFERDKKTFKNSFQESEKEINLIDKILKDSYIPNNESAENSCKGLDKLDNFIENQQLKGEKNNLIYISKFISQQIEKEKSNESRINRLDLMNQLLLAISSISINVTNEKIISTKLETLKKLAEFVRADRAYIFNKNNNNQILSKDLEWCNFKITPQIEYLHQTLIGYISKKISLYKRGELFEVSNTNELQNDSIKRILKQLNVKSLLVFPVWDKKECIGYIGLESINNYYNYSFEEIDILNFFGQMIANLEERKKNELESKHNLLLQKTLLTNIHSGILLEDENRNILFTNQLFCDYFSISTPPDNLIGSNCTESAELTKNLFEDSEQFSLRIKTILSNRKSVFNEILEMKNGIFLERDYIPLYINNNYKGHLWKYTDITSRVKAKILLEQSEERNRLIMNSALNAIINIDIKGRVTFWNKQAEKMFGWTKEEVLNKTLTNTIIPNQHRKGHEDGMANYITTGNGPVLNKQIEITALKKDGTEFPIEISILPIQQNNEEFFCSFIQDISTRKKAENKLKLQEEKYRNIITNMNLGLIEVNTNNQIQFANQSFVEISGYEKEELIGKVPEILFVNGKNKKIITSKNKLRKQGKSDIYQIAVKNKRGELKWWAVSGAPNYDSTGKMIGSIGIHLDITEQKQLEIELENEKIKAQEASKSKEAFLANMSHEIRTPLNAIIGFLREVEKENITDYQRDYIKNSIIASKHLLSIINNILDMSKIEAKEMTLENQDFDLHKSIQNVISILKPKAIEKGLKIEFNFDENINNALKGDSLRIEQVLFNLIGNSLKFTQNGFIKVECRLVKDTSCKQNICISIIDSGIGMDYNFVNSIFTKFSQEEVSTTRKFGGTGLGMAITKELIELMNGLITIKSKKNNGTTIKINLNLDKGSTKNIIKENNKLVRINLTDIKILLVEDNEFNRIVAQNSLKDSNCELVQTENGLEAINILKENTFDVILMDIQMPIMDGFEATTIIRNILKLDTPIIALTANAFKTELEKCKMVGMNDYITKPFEDSLLLETISKYVNKPEIELSSNQSNKELFNLDNLYSLDKGNNEFIEKMIIIFIKQTNEAIIEIENSINNKNFLEVSRLIHKIKPSIEGMGIKSIYKEVKNLETLSKTSKDKNKINNQFISIKEVLIETIKQLENRI